MRVPLIGVGTVYLQDGRCLCWWLRQRLICTCGLCNSNASFGSVLLVEGGWTAGREDRGLYQGNVLVQALVATITGLPLHPSDQWGLVIVVLPAGTPLESPRGMAEAWIAQLGLRWLPGQRSDARRMRAQERGVQFPIWLWNWLTTCHPAIRTRHARLTTSRRSAKQWSRM